MPAERFASSASRVLACRAALKPRQREARRFRCAWAARCSRSCKRAGRCGGRVHCRHSGSSQRSGGRLCGAGASRRRRRRRERARGRRRDGLSLEVASGCDGPCNASADVPVVISSSRGNVPVHVQVVRSPHVYVGYSPQDVPWGTSTWLDQTVQTGGDGRATVLIPHPTDELASTYGVRVESGGATAVHADRRADRTRRGSSATRSRASKRSARRSTSTSSARTIGDRPAARRRARERSTRTRTVNARPTADARCRRSRARRVHGAVAWHEFGFRHDPRRRRASDRRRSSGYRLAGNTGHQPQRQRQRAHHPGPQHLPRRRGRRTSMRRSTARRATR